jgi:soluble lytic murein transglycosylase-like protein
MFDTARHGGSVGRFAGGSSLITLPRRLALAGALLCGAFWLPGASAGALYRCTGGGGETVFSSSTTGYHGCKRISTFGGSSSRKAPARRASLARASGNVATSARSLAADGTEPVSLANVQGSAQTSATAVGAASVRRASLAQVEASVSTTGKGAHPAPVVAPAKPAQWSYRESRDAEAAPATAIAPSTKVLRGAVYRVVGHDGTVEYTNLPPRGRKAATLLFSYIATCAACDLHSTIRWGRVALNLTAYNDTIRAASLEYGVDEAFLRAIIHAESAFNPRALSIKGAQGLMQLMPGTASDMGVLDAFDAEQNIRGGARYLGLLLQDFHGNERLAAAAYNAGPGAVQRYNGVPPYAETKVYVERVGTLRQRYGAAIHPPLAASGPG